MIIESLDGISGAFIQIKETSREAAYEVMSKAGNYVKEGARSKMKSYSHHWFRKKYKDGVVRPYYSRGSTKQLGIRIANDTGKKDNPKSMSSFITSFLMEKSGTVIVGGTHKAFYPILRDNAKIVGIGRRVGGVSRATQAILNKMDTGKFNSYYRDSGYTKNPKYITRPFMLSGFMSAQGKVRSTLETEFTKIIDIGLKRDKVPVKFRRYA